MGTTWKGHEGLVPVRVLAEAVECRLAILAGAAQGW